MQGPLQALLLMVLVACFQCTLRTMRKKEQMANVQESHPIMRYFGYSHLKGVLKDTSEKFYFLAYEIDQLLPNGPEKTVALRKLLEAKDAAVRSALDLL